MRQRKNMTWKPEMPSGVSVPPAERGKWAMPDTLGQPRKSGLVDASGRALDSATYCCDVLDFMRGQSTRQSFIGYASCANLAQDGLMRLGVETLADEMTRKWGHVAGADEDAAAKLEETMQRLRVRQVLGNAASDAGYFGVGYVFLDTGEREEAELMTPLFASAAKLGPQGIMQLRRIDPVLMSPGEYNAADPLSRWYYRPRWWFIQGRKVHATRLLRVVQHEPPLLLLPVYNFGGIPAVQLALDYLVHFTGTRESAAKLLKKFSLTVFKANLNALLYGADGAEADVMRRLKYFAQNRDNDGVELIDKDDEDIVQINTPLSGVTEIVRQALEMLAAIFPDTIKSLVGDGAEVIVASESFGVDDMENETGICKIAKDMGLEATAASEITKLYGLTRRTRTAAINASILPKMLNTANSTEQSVKSAGVEVPLMIMRGDGGVMEISEMKKRPVLTMLSGPAASVMGSLMYLRASNGVYFEVGGTTTNIGVIKDGRPAIDYSVVGGHRTYISSLDVRVLGVAGGSMVRADKSGVKDVGPRSAHIAGLDYAVFTPEEEIVDPKVVFFSPKEGDPEDYVAIELKNGKRITITNTCAANVLGLIKPEYFAYGNANAARKAMQPLADYIGKTVEEVATQILTRAYEKIEPIIMDLADKYRLEKDQISLVGVGGGAAALIGFCSDKMGLRYSIPDNAEVISSIGVALAMVRDVVERVVPNPTPEDIRSIKAEAIDKAVESGAAADSVDVHIEIDPQTSKLTAIALGSTEVKTTDLLKECTAKEARELAAEDLKVAPSEVNEECATKNFYVFAIEGKGKHPVRILDKKGFIKVQRNDGKAILCKAGSYRNIVSQLWEELAIYQQDAILRPDYYICAGARVMDFSGSVDLDKIMMLMEVEMQMIDPGDDVIIVGAKNSL